MKMANFASKNGLGKPMSVVVAVMVAVALTFTSSPAAAQPAFPAPAGNPCRMIEELAKQYAQLLAQEAPKCALDSPNILALRVKLQQLETAIAAKPSTCTLSSDDVFGSGPSAKPKVRTRDDLCGPASTPAATASPVKKSDLTLDEARKMMRLEGAKQYIEDYERDTRNEERKAAGASYAQQMLKDKAKLDPRPRARLDSYDSVLTQKLPTDAAQDYEEYKDRFEKANQRIVQVAGNLNCTEVRVHEGEYQKKLSRLNALEAALKGVDVETTDEISVAGTPGYTANADMDSADAESERDTLKIEVAALNRNRDWICPPKGINQIQTYASLIKEQDRESIPDEDVAKADKLLTDGLSLMSTLPRKGWLMICMADELIDPPGGYSYLARKSRLMKRWGKHVPPIFLGLSVGGGGGFDWHMENKIEYAVSTRFLHIHIDVETEVAWKFSKNMDIVFGGGLTMGYAMYEARDQRNPTGQWEREHLFLVGLTVHLGVAFYKRASIELFGKSYVSHRGHLGGEGGVRNLWSIGPTGLGPFFSLGSQELQMWDGRNYSDSEVNPKGGIQFELIF